MRVRAAAMFAERMPLRDRDGEEALDARRGFEPRLTESESVVLPLDDRAPEAGRNRRGMAGCQRRCALACRDAPPALALGPSTER